MKIWDALIFIQNKGKFYHISAKIIKSLQALIFSGLQAFKDNGGVGKSWQQTA